MNLYNKDHKYSISKALGFFGFCYITLRYYLMVVVDIFHSNKK